MLGQSIWRSFLIVFTLFCASQNAHAIQATVSRVFDVKAGFEQVLSEVEKNHSFIFEDPSKRTEVVSVTPTTTTVAAKAIFNKIYLTYRINLRLTDDYFCISFRQVGSTLRLVNGSSIKLEIWRITRSHSRVRMTVWVDAGFRWHLYSHRLASAINRQIDTIAARVRYLEGKQAASQEVKREKPSKMLIAESVIHHIFNGVGKLIEGEKK